ncbi:uncharacterized protein LOC120011714 [Tripterygium wilfordii]|uniref:uncharacterized protein LOC120011714 n=1 Tax=Tripterygium wilfordii TaxID=458696 RepID=UPI0018F81EC6|nr:uncharacterized protein LOC120011714 [Tripterygium wilfordii]
MPEPPICRLWQPNGLIGGKIIAESRRKYQNFTLDIRTSQSNQSLGQPSINDISFKIDNSSDRTVPTQASIWIRFRAHSPTQLPRQASRYSSSYPFSPFRVSENTTFLSARDSLTRIGMKKSARMSSIGAGDLRVSDTVGSFSTRFSLNSFVKRVQKLTNDQKAAITNIGFGNLLLLSNHMLGKNLLLELMNRWSCEQQAFILHIGKISITLMDIVLILGLRVVGRPVILRDEEPFSDLEKDFGAGLWNRKVKITSLESQLDSFGETVNDQFIRTFLLFAIGSLLFPNTSGKVDSRYLSFLKNLDDVSQFAWGAAVLEDIILWLNRRKKENIQYVGGCLLFLQIWSYEHIDIARPRLVEKYLAFPRACRWESSRSHQRQLLMTKFKDLQGDQITWKLEPTLEELEVDVIKELLESESDANEPPREQYSAINILEALKIDSGNGSANEVHVTQHANVSVADGAAVEIDSDMDITDDKHGPGEVNLEQKASKCELMIRNCSSVNPYTSSPHKENIEIASTSEHSYTSICSGIEDDLITRNQMLEEQYMALKKEMDILKQEMASLRNQNVKLQKEADDLRKENRHISLSTNNLVVRLERLLVDEDVIATEGI